MMMRRRWAVLASGGRLPLLGLLAIALTGVVGCSHASPDPSAISGKFNVAGRSIFMECAGSGRTTVVMDAGLGNSHETWRDVVTGLSGATRVCTYDRANIGQSSPAAKPRTSAEVVADLAAVLAAAKVPPPYLLVGHSFGGINMQLFAQTRPTEVAGIVLVDPTPLTFLDDECALVNHALCLTLRSGFAAANNPDGLDFIRSTAEVQKAGGLPQVPVAILAATDHHQDAITDDRTDRLIETAWRTDQEHLAASIPGATLTVVKGGHDIQTLHPDAVITAVKKVLQRLGSPPS